MARPRRSRDMERSTPGPGPAPSPSWEEHLRQHRERQTGTDLQYHDAAAALSDPPPQTEHYLAAAVPD
jgi:hypothetical protein